MKNAKHIYRLKLRIPPGDLLDREFSTKEEAEDYAERIFLLHPEADWRDLFRAMEAKD